MSGFSIRQLCETDWPRFQQIRLESLAKYPQYFAPSRDETKYTTEDWIEVLVNRNAASFGLFHETNLIGITSIIRKNNNSSSERALMMASYIRDEYRGKNLSRFFYEARIEWAKKEKDIKSLLIFHREGNLISKRANQRFGFKYISSFKKTYLDGSEGLSFCYELKL